MDNEKKIEIPFGAFDSELIRQEISIPNGFKATIEGDKIILTRIESEDEKIRKELIFYLGDMPEDTELRNGVTNRDVLVWLEKQGEQKPTIEMKSAEESLGIDSETYNKIVNECIYGEQKQVEWNEYDEMYVSALIAIVGKDGVTGKNLRDELTGWLNCLKSRFVRNG